MLRGVSSKQKEQCAHLRKKEDIVADGLGSEGEG